MKRGIVLVLALSAVCSVAYASDDPIKARQALMKANVATVKQIIVMLKSDAAFDLATVHKALNAYIASADKAPALFPDGSDHGKTDALPLIWSNKADFDGRFRKLGKDAKAALALIKDTHTLKMYFPHVLKNCLDCHEQYRAKQQ